MAYAVSVMASAVSTSSAAMVVSNDIGGTERADICAEPEGATNETHDGMRKMECSG